MTLKASSDMSPHDTAEQQLRARPQESTRSEDPLEDREPFVDAVRAAGFLSLSPRRVLTLARHDGVTGLRSASNRSKLRNG